MLVSLLIAVTLVVVTILIHYEALRLVSKLVSSATLPLRFAILVGAILCFAAHVTEIFVYGAAFIAVSSLGLGSLEGTLTGDASDYFYFSASAYSTVGFGDVYPTGALRLVSAFEAVNGLFLIAWSTSFTYLAMERLWPLHSRITSEKGPN